MGQLEGKVAIITGGGTGLGAACAKVFSREGAMVTVVGRRLEKLDDTAELIRSTGGSVEVVAGDVSIEATAADVVERTIEAFGGIDILVNNAGLHVLPFLIHEHPVDRWDEMINVNLRGPFLFTRAAVPSMIERGGGSIMNVASMLGLVGTKYSSSYATAKAGLIELTKITAVDYGEHSIRANCICPGGMQPADLIDMSPEDLAKIMESVHAAGGFPISRFAHMTEVAEFILTVVGPVGLSMTGSVIAFDGGYTAK